MTENPWLIAVINMTIVFGVLILLGLLMKLIYLVDPTRKKTPQAKKPLAAKPASTAAAKRQEEEKVAAIAAVLAMVQDDDAVTAALMAAIAEHKRKMEPMALPQHFF
jgi:sodium pump decarboxylase gamma subunit